jgi:hypothetical protein
MSKGSIEWEHNAQDGLVLRIKPGSIDPASAASAAAAAGEMIQQARKARKEILMAVKDLVDLALQRMDEKTPATEQHGTKIKVE